MLPGYSKSAICYAHRGAGLWRLLQIVLPCRVERKKQNRMATPEDLHGTKELILRDFELEEGEEPIATEEDLLRLLADQIAGMIEYNLEVLLSNLYRLDVQEAKVNYALSPHCPEPANVALARLVLQRQKQRAYTKKHFQQPDLGGLGGLEL